MEKCENCELQLPTVKMMLHKRYCMFIMKQCAVCHKMILIEEEIEHLYEHYVECSFCKGMFNINDINVHKDICDMKYEECVYCKGIIYLKEKDEHEIQCGAKTEQCKRCGEFVVVKNKEQHLKWECGVAERKYCDNNYIEYVYKGKKGKKKGKHKGKNNDNSANKREWSFVGVGGVKGNFELINEKENVNEDMNVKVNVNVKQQEKDVMNVVINKDKGNDIKTKHNKHNKTQKKHLNKKPIINNIQYDEDYDEYNDDYCEMNLNLHNLKHGIPQHSYRDLSIENEQLQEAIRRSIYQQ